MKASDTRRCAGRNLGRSHQQRPIKHHVASRSHTILSSSSIRCLLLYRKNASIVPPWTGDAPSGSRLSLPSPPVVALTAGRRRPCRSPSSPPPPAVLAGYMHAAAYARGCSSRGNGRSSGATATAPVAPVAPCRQRACRKKYTPSVCW